MARKPQDNTSTANIGFEQKLWLAADKLRSNMDAAEYKHVVLGLIFRSRAERDRSRDSVTRGASRGLRVKYISDTAGKFRMANAEVRTRNARPIQHSKLAIRHLRPPADARWSHLQACAKQPERKAEVRMPKEEPCLQHPTSSFPLPTWPDAMVAIERDWPMATAEERMWN